MQESFQHILIKYSSDIGSKSEGVRKRFSTILRNNIANAFPGAKVKSKWDHILFHHPEASSFDLSKIPGISTYSFYKKDSFTTFDDLLLKAYEFFKEQVQDKTFVVRCKRRGRHPFRSPEVERELGSWLVANGKVDLFKPEVTCHLEIKDDEVFFYHNKINGTGGLPIGSQGRALMLFSGGIDSAVAAFNAYKSGVSLHYLFFDLGGEEQLNCAKNTLQRVLDYRCAANKTQKWYINFAPLIAEIMKVDSSYRNLALKYCFYKVAAMVADQSKMQVIFTGESIGQVSTQTLPNLATLSTVSDIPVFRPLLSFTKQEIITIAKEIGTYEISYKGIENCALTSKTVETKARPENLLEQVQRINPEVFEKVANEIKNLDEVVPGHEKPVGEDLKNRKIIDLREAEQRQKHIPGGTLVSFENAWVEFHDWPNEEKYMLVCAHGERSALLAQYMKEAGYDATFCSEKDILK